MTGAASEFHLEEAILSVDVTLGKEQVPFVLGEDLGDPESISQHLYGAT
jgi:hypothetical protein